MAECLCKNCESLCNYKKPGNKTSEHYCNHPNQESIRKYFDSHGIKKAYGFLGFGHGELELKRTPKWCPKADESDNQNWYSDDIHTDDYW